jgi:hypothetical protein
MAIVSRAIGLLGSWGFSRHITTRFEAKTQGCCCRRR